MPTSKPRPTATIPNPALYDDDDVRADVADQCLDLDTLYAALPEDSHLLPETGAWICVMAEPHVEITVPALSLWFAKPFYRSRKFQIGGKGSARGGRRQWVPWPLLRAVLQTPEGELQLLPTEYQRLRRGIGPLLDMVGKGLTMHWLDGHVPDELDEREFYLRSRGFSRRDALTLLLPGLEDQGFVYFTTEVP